MNDRWFATLATLSLAIAAAACADEGHGPDNLEPSDQVTAGEEELGYVAPGTEYALPERGGSGGSPAPQLRGTLIVGLQVNTGRLVDRLEVYHYRPEREDNRFQEGDPLRTLGPVGGNGGAAHGVEWCPQGFVAIGIQGRAAAKLDALGLICGNLDDLSEQHTTPVYGGGGGQAFVDTCEPGFVLTGLNIRSARVIDRIQGICQKLK